MSQSKFKLVGVDPEGNKMQIRFAIDSESVARAGDNAARYVIEHVAMAMRMMATQSIKVTDLLDMQDTYSLTLEKREP
jgi:hypothetical protein